jgi:hypothetical protein
MPPMSPIELYLGCFLWRLCAMKNATAAANSPAPPTAPTDIPIFAPVDRPESSVEVVLFLLLLLSVVNPGICGAGVRFGRSALVSAVFVGRKAAVGVTVTTRVFVSVAPPDVVNESSTTLPQAAKVDP